MDLSSDEQPVSSRPRRFHLKRLLLALALLMLLVSGIGAGPQTHIADHLPPLLSVKTFHVPFVPEDSLTHTDEHNPAMELLQILAGPDGNLYFLPDFSTWIGRMTLDGQVSRIFLPLPSDISFVAWGGLSEGNGNIWATELFGDGLWRFDPSNGTLKNYEPLRQSPGGTIDYWNGVATADGSVWLEVVDDHGLFAARAQAIGHLDPQTGVLTTYPIQQNADGWGPLAQDSDGTLWIITARIDAAAGITTSIGVKRFNPQTGTITTFTIAPTFPKFEPTVPPGEVDSNGNPVTSFPLQFPDVTYPPAVEAGLPVADSPMITPASDGGIWVLCEGHAPDGFISYPVHITPTGVQHTSLAPDGGSVVALAPGLDNKLWVIYYDPALIPHYVLGQLNAGGSITPIGRLNDSQPRYLTVGPDHHLWMTTAWSNAIEQVDLPG